MQPEKINEPVASRINIFFIDKKFGEEEKDNENYIFHFETPGPYNAWPALAPV